MKINNALIPPKGLNRSENKKTRAVSEIRIIKESFE